MRLLKVILVGLITAFAVTAGLVVTACVVLATLVFFAIARVLRGAKPAQNPAPVSGRASPSKVDGVIDITATEVPSDPPTH